MKRIYEKFKGLTLKYDDGIEGTVCGFTDDNLLVATVEAPRYSFEKFKKEPHFIEKEFKGGKYRYCYCLETMAEKYATL